MRLTKDLVAIPITLGFGKSEPPKHFSYLSWFMDYCHEKRMQMLLPPRPPLSMTYVDDTAGFFNESIALSEKMAHAEQVNKYIPQLNNEAKFVMTTRGELLGIRIDTVAEVAGMSFKAYLKLCFILFMVLPRDITTSTMIPLKSLQVIASLSFYNSQYLVLMRYAPSVLFKTLDRGDGPRSLNARQIDCINTWRDLMVYSFSHTQVLHTSLYDMYHNSPMTKPILTPMGLEIFTDSEMTTMGNFVPGLGWLDLAVETVFGIGVVRSIAHYEFVAFIVAFLFAKFLAPHSDILHIRVDNSNAQTWSTGSFGTNDSIVNNITCANCFLQIAFKTTQTRKYIKSEDNQDADEISRKRFANLDKLPRYCATSPLLVFLRKLVKPRDLTALAIAQLIHMLQESGVSSLFSLFSASHSNV